MSPEFRAWLVKFGRHVAVGRVFAFGQFTPEQVRADVLETGVLDGVDRAGDIWLMEALRGIPFEAPRKPGRPYVLAPVARGVLRVTDYPFPGPPPAVRA
jgi:hypothetical protein